MSTKKKISVRLDGDQHARVTCMAALLDRSVNEIVVELLDDWAEQHKEEAQERFAAVS